MLKPAYNFHVHDVGIFDDLHGVGKTAWLNSGIDKPTVIPAYAPKGLCDDGSEQLSERFDHLVVSFDVRFVL